MGAFSPPMVEVRRNHLFFTPHFHPYFAYGAGLIIGFKKVRYPNQSLILSKFITRLTTLATNLKSDCLYSMKRKLAWIEFEASTYQPSHSCRGAVSGPVRVMARRRGGAVWLGGPCWRLVAALECCSYTTLRFIPPFLSILMKLEMRLKGPAEYWSPNFRSPS